MIEGTHQASPARQNRFCESWRTGNCIRKIVARLTVPEQERTSDEMMAIQACGVSRCV